MNKLKMTSLTLLASALLMGCSTQHSDSVGKKARGMMVGAYTNHRSMSDEEKTLFENTYKGEVKLTPKKVATQVVAGTNYSYVCKDSKGKTYEVVIYQPLPGQGKPEVTSVTEK